MIRDNRAWHGGSSAYQHFVHCARNDSFEISLLWLSLMRIMLPRRAGTPNLGAPCLHGVATTVDCHKIVESRARKRAPVAMC